MNYLFIIDSSKSMTQRAANKLSFLKVAKNFVESFIMTRVKMSEAKGDKFYIFSTNTEERNEIKDYAFVNDIAHVIWSLRSIEST
jgi:hypothetical protein